MTAYEILWDFEEDHYGIVTTSQAVAMGIDKHQLPAMAKRGTLIFFVADIPSSPGTLAQQGGEVLGRELLHDGRVGR